jgi:hypothetical protein
MDLDRLTHGRILNLTLEDAFGLVISPSQKPLPTQDNTKQIDGTKSMHMLKRDSNPRSQRSRPTPQTVRPLGPTGCYRQGVFLCKHIEVHTYGVRQATACSVLCCKQTQGPPLHLIFGSRDGEDVSIHGCIDNLIIMHHLYHIIFSVPITKDTHKKVKQSHNTPMEAQGEEEVQLLLIRNLGTRWREWSASHSGRPFTPGKSTPRFPLDRRLGGHQSWSGHRR